MLINKERTLENNLSKKNYETLINAYDFCLDDEGYLCGLVAGDMGWDRTSIQVPPDKNRLSRHLGRLVNTIPCILYDYVRWPDGRKQIVYVSSHAKEIFGYTAERFIDQQELFWSMIHPADIERMKTEDRTINPMKTKFQIEIRIIDSSGEIKWIQLASMPSDEKLDGQTIWSGVALDITRRKQVEMDRDRLIMELQKALAEIKTLKGILPICSICKKIRDDAGNWQPVEKYVTERTNADFSHGLCPECLQAHYPEFYKPED